MICKVTKAPLYVRLFDKNATGWCWDEVRNRYFLVLQQSYANDLLKARGHLFLNDVFDLLGVPRTRYGQIIGWIYDENNPNGDNCVDFGFGDVCPRKGVNGAIVLNFNVDGDILSKI